MPGSAWHFLLQCHHKSMGRILGLDLGDKTIGVAVSDELHWTAQGVTTLKRTTTDKDLAALDELVDSYEVEEIIVGLPRNMDYSLGAQAEKTIAFTNTLETHLDAINVTLWDERLSTSTASKVLIEADISRKKQKRVVNTLAAVVILQSYLDAQTL